MCSFFSIEILDSEQTDKQRALLFCDVWKFEFPQMILTGFLNYFLHKIS